MAGNLTAMIASIFSGSAVSTDPYFNYTTLLLSTTATNGQQNNTFQDSSTNNFTITRNPATGPNAPTQGTFSPFSQTGWGNYFDGSSYLSLGVNSAFDLGTGDFSIECWVYPLNTATGKVWIGAHQSATPDGYYILLNPFSLQVYSNGGGGGGVTSTTAPTVNIWNHLLVTRQSGRLRCFLNGVLTDTNATSYTINQDGRDFRIANIVGSAQITAYLSNIRFIKGSVPTGYQTSSTTVGTSIFTPSTTAITLTSQGAVSNDVKVLTCQSNRFIDNSTNNFTITVNGNTSVVAFSPFNPTASWSAATNGGSGYFDGTGDYLSAPDDAAFSLGSGDWTIETYFNLAALPASTGAATFASQWRSSSSISFGWFAYLYNNAGTYQLLFSYSTTGSNQTNLSVNLSSAPVINSWYHIAFVRSGNNFLVFLNGAQVGATQTLSATIFDSTAPVWIGAQNAGGSPDYPLNGYLSSFRIVKGTAVYTSNFTPPTSPLTAITNTSLLLNFTNSGIYDATAKNVLETVGSAQVSTTTSQWSSTSMLFNGTTDYLQVNTASNLYNLSSGDWTIEAWVYRTSTATNKSGIITYLDGTFGTPNGWAFDCGATSVGQLGFYGYSGSIITTNISSSAGAVPINTWTYVAARCVGTAITLYINGASVASGTRGTIENNANCRLRIGSWNYSTSYRYWQGYIQDPRITKGYARTITTPTAAFPVQ